MTTLTWAGRRGQHDDAARPIVEEAFQRWGFELRQRGQETECAAIREALRGRTDLVALMERFKSDAIAVKAGARLLLAEIKSEAQGSANYAIEVDAYLAAVAHANVSDGHLPAAMLLCVDVPFRRISCCWIRNIPRPFQIVIPKRQDWRESDTRLRGELLGVIVAYREHERGSGTPYFLIPKDAEYLESFDDFMRALEYRG